jgi:hypothetical protein
MVGAVLADLVLVGVSKLVVLRHCIVLHCAALSTATVLWRQPAHSIWVLGVKAAAAAAAHWVPASLVKSVDQAAAACAKLQYRHPGLMAALLQHGQQLLLPASAEGRKQRTQQSNGSGPADKDTIVGKLCSAVTHLDMQQLAPQALQLVTISGIVRRAHSHPSNLRRLWLFHSWLLQHRLLDGQGLTGLLTQEQLQQGKREAALRPDMF